MLQVDLKRSDRELSQLIGLRCSGFGTVKSVTIHRDPTPFALVEMATPDETLKLAGHFGRSVLGSSALIRLQQESRAANPGCYSV